MTMAFLVRIDPARHMDRWYSVRVQATLLDDCAVVCAWGNRRTSYQRVRWLPARSVVEAETLAAEVVGRKLRRGYRLAGD